MVQTYKLEFIDFKQIISFLLFSFFNMYVQNSLIHFIKFRCVICNALILISHTK